MAKKNENINVHQTLGQKQGIYEGTDYYRGAIYFCNGVSRGAIIMGTLGDY